jgi:Flp pilus assembly secretin CpaC
MWQLPLIGLFVKSIKVTILLKDMLIEEIIILAPYLIKPLINNARTNITFKLYNIT